MQKWEYRMIRRPTQDDLNRYGEKGWELVAIDDNGWFYFKRPSS
jgi:hypothetical protein